MQIARSIFQFLFFIALSVDVNAKTSPLKKEAFSPSNLPRFEFYPVTEIYTGKIADVKLNSYPEAQRFRTHLRQGSKAGPNFAGHYTILSIGCGSNCQNQWIVDAKSGKVLARFLTSYDAAYRVDSNLLILNPPSLEAKKLYKTYPQAYGLEKIVYVVWEKDKPRVLYDETFSKFYDAYLKKNIEKQ